MTTDFRLTIVRLVCLLCLFSLSAIKANEPDLSNRAAIEKRLEDRGAHFNREADGSIRFAYISDRCTDAELALLPAFPEMKAVQIRSPLITDAGLVHLRKLPNVQMVDEIPAQITDAGIEHLAALQELRSLRLPPKATDACMPHVAKLTNLMSIQLCSAITDAGLAHLVGLPMLGNIDVTSSQVTNRGIEQLIARHLHLRTLDLSQSDLVTTAALRDLPNLKHFQILRGPNDCSDETLKILGKVPLVQHVFVADYPAVTDNGLEHLLGMRWLRTQELGAGITDVGMQHIAKMTRHIRLDLRKTKITGVGLAAIRHRGATELFLPPTVGDDGLACFDDFYPVDHLILTGGYTDKALEHVAKLKPLRMFTLEGTKVTEDGLLQFRKQRPTVSGSVRDIDGLHEKYWGHR